MVFFYKEYMKNYVGLTGLSSPNDKVFDCPAECAWGPWFHLPSQSAYYDYSCYDLNGQMIAIKVTSVVHPAKTALEVEFPVQDGCYSWHQPQSDYVMVFNSLGFQEAAFNNALDNVGFMDGHVSYIKIYNDGVSQSWAYEPPDGYDYQWNGN